MKRSLYLSPTKIRLSCFLLVVRYLYETTYKQKISEMALDCVSESNRLSY